MTDISVIGGHDSPVVDKRELAAYLIEQAALLTGPEGPPGEPGEPGEPGAPGVPGSDATVTDLAMFAAYGPNLKDRIKIDFPARGEMFINAKDYYVAGDGVTDDITGLQNAANAAFAQEKTLFIPGGNYRINDTLKIKCSILASDAFLWYYGTGTALVVGDNSALAMVTQRKTFHLPKVWNRSRGTVAWTPNTIGVDLVTLDTCQIHLPYVRDCAINVRCYGYGGGFAYNQLFLGQLFDGRVGIKFTNASGGWASQNNVIGGRIQQTKVNGATTDDIDSTYVYIDASCNNNTFVGTSIENSSGDTDNAGYYRVIQASRYNMFMNCRWETKAGQFVRILTKPTGSANVIDNGYAADKIIDVVEAGGTPHIIRDTIGGFYRQSNSSVQSIPNAVNTVMTGWPEAGLNKIAYDPATGNFTPRAGTWRIHARAAYGANATGVRKLFLQTPGGTLSTDEAPNAATTVPMTVFGTYKFSGTNSFNIQTYQNSGGNLALASSAYCRLEAEYLGY